MNIEKHKEQIIKKFEEIDYKNGLILIENIINDKYDNNLIINIIFSLSKNKKKYTYEIYDYIIKNTNINYDTEINYYINIINLKKIMKFIYLCAINGNIHLLNYLLEKDINVNLENDNGETALIFASLSPNHTSLTVKFLLENGANPNLQGDCGVSALMFASTEECKNLIKSYMN